MAEHDPSLYGDRIAAFYDDWYGGDLDTHTTDRLWALYGRPGVSLATSYYSPHAVEHDAITGRRSHAAR